MKEKCMVFAFLIGIIIWALAIWYLIKANIIIEPYTNIFP